MLPDSGPFKLPEEAATLNQHRSCSQEEAAPPADSWFSSHMWQASPHRSSLLPEPRSQQEPPKRGAHHVTVGGICCWGCWRGGWLQGQPDVEPVVCRWAALEQRPRVTKACAGDGGTKVSSDQEQKTKVSSKRGAPDQPLHGGSCFIHQCQGNINGMDSSTAAAASWSSSKGRAWRSSAVCHPHLQQTSFPQLRKERQTAVKVQPQSS